MHTFQKVALLILVGEGAQIENIVGNQKKHEVSTSGKNGPGLPDYNNEAWPMESWIVMAHNHSESAVCSDQNR